MRRQQFKPHRDEKLNEVLQHDFKMQLNCFGHFPKVDWPKIPVLKKLQKVPPFPPERIIPKLKNVVIHFTEEEIQSRRNCKEKSLRRGVCPQNGNGKLFQIRIWNNSPFKWQKIKKCLKEIRENFYLFIFLFFRIWFDNFPFFREPETNLNPNAVDVLGKSLYVDLNQLSTLRRPSAPAAAPPAQRQSRCFEPESTRSGAKSILLTEDVLSVSDYSSLTALRRPSRYSFCSQPSGDLEPDLIQVIFLPNNSNKNIWWEFWKKNQTNFFPPVRIFKNHFHIFLFDFAIFFSGSSNARLLGLLKVRKSYFIRWPFFKGQ